MPKWLALVSYLVAAFLLLSTVMHPVAMLLFPAWVVIAGLVVFIRGMLAVGYGMVFVYALRGAGMYALTTTTLLRSGKIMPTWLAVLSYLMAVFLLLITTLHPAAVLVFPAWVVIVGVMIFIRAGRVAEPTVSERQSA